MKILFSGKYNKMSISQSIKSFGNKSPEKVYEGVKTYKDLIATNVAFLQGKLPYTPYHGGPIDPETVPLMKSLVKINKAGFLSIEGQPSSHEVKFVEHTWKDNEGKTAGNWWYANEQKSYICGFMPKEHLEKFIRFMGNKHDYYYQLVINCTPTQMLFTTFPTSPYNVTRERSHKQKGQLSKEKWRLYTNIWSIDGDHDPRYSFDRLRNCYDLLENTLYVTIASKEYNTGSVEELLMEFYGC
jgi:hypothetical protein